MITSYARKARRIGIPWAYAGGLVTKCAEPARPVGRVRP
jgi:hypothetical protein